MASLPAAVGDPFAALWAKTGKTGQPGKTGKTATSMRERIKIGSGDCRGRAGAEGGRGGGENLGQGDGDGYGPLDARGMGPEDGPREINGHASTSFGQGLGEGEENGEDGEEDGEGEEIRQVHRAPTERKRRENSAFELWLEREQRAITARGSSRPGGAADFGPGSVLGDGLGEKIISSPREYQLELFERAREKNTIVVLDTGSGKTLIAALLLRHILEQELEHRSQGRPHKTAFFLVEKVALCFQQHNVLSRNLQFPIGKFFGDMTGIMRTKDFWDRQLAENMAIVCTAQVLLDLLDCSFVQIPKINLLIFDEAHHTKKNHPYARIIKNHYLPEDPVNRPRILGMTASPVDAKASDVRLAATQLESILCSTIATVSDEVLLRGHAHRQQSELRVEYARLPLPEESRTELFAKIVELVGENPQFRDHLQSAQQASAALGSWCADRYWKLLLSDYGSLKLEARTGDDFADDFDVACGDEAVAAVQRVADMVRTWPSQEIIKCSPCLSTKVEVLFNLLEDVFLRREAKRCIVFVQARSTAFLLSDLFQQRQMLIPGVTAAYMTGSNSSSSITTMSYRDQVLALFKFRRGETNCLFATSVAEEGIDIPECDVIIRFDLFTSAIQYIQSKGRARQKSSTYIMMMENGNIEHLKRVQQATRDSHALRRFCSALPEDRKVQDFVIDAATMAESERLSQKVYHIQETGARLTFVSSLELVARFTSSLPGLHKVEYIVTSVARKFVAHIIFPNISPVKRAVGEPQRTKQLARCSAAFEACVELIKKGYIDTHLQPEFAKKLPTMRNARLALKSDKKSEYEMLLKPKFWSRCLECPSSALFATVLKLDEPDVMGRISRPLVLLTRLALPEVPSFPLFFGNGRKSILRPEASVVQLDLAHEELGLLAKFTLRLFADVFSKEYAANLAEIPYLIAPYHSRFADTFTTAGADQIDWSLLEYIRNNEELSWEHADQGLFLDRLAIDPFDGSRKYILDGIEMGMKPSDPTPKGMPAIKSAAYKRVAQTIQEYSNSLTFQSRNKVNWRQDQPVLKAELLSTRRNFLDEFLLDSSPSGHCYVIPEPLRLSPIPLDIVSMALILPVIMYRIDNSLITLEACADLDLRLRPELALEAMTKDSVNSEEHGQESLDFQPGMGKNYERLEFLGDTFLKMATTISVFTLLPTADEFECHVERMVMLCNRNLFNHATLEDRRLKESIRSKAFDRRAWYPEMKLRKGKSGKTKDRHSLSHKSIADVCEALIGAAYMSHMPGKTEVVSRHGEKLDAAVHAVTVMVNSQKHKMKAFREYWAAFTVPEWHGRRATAAQQFTVDAVSKAIDYRFKSGSLLRSAFKHSSYTFEATIPDYQRLEFLGDALLDMVVVDFLFKRFPEADPQWLTEHKMVMASNKFLAFLSVKLGLHKHILMTTSSLLGEISEYVTQLSLVEEASQLMSRRTVNSGNGDDDDDDDDDENGQEMATTERNPGTDAWTVAPRPPKALADVLEALVGALFVDTEFDYGAVQRFFRAHIQVYFEDMSSFGLNELAGRQHPVTALTQRLSTDFGCSQWNLHVASVPPLTSAGVAVLSESEVLCALTVHGAVLFHETAKSGSEAKLAVCKVAVSSFSDWQPGVFQARTGCDCLAAATTKGPREELVFGGTLEEMA